MPGPPRILAIIAIATLLAGCAAAPKQAGVGPKPGPHIVAGSQGCDACAVVGDRVFFSFNSATLSKKAWATLIEQAKWLVKYPARSLLIAGNCDERDTEEYNLALGYRRANADRDFLIANGIAAKRIKVISYGKELPIATGSNEQAWT